MADHDDVPNDSETAKTRDEKLMDAFDEHTQKHVPDLREKGFIVSGEDDPNRG